MEKIVEGFGEGFPGLMEVWERFGEEGHWVLGCRSMQTCKLSAPSWSNARFFISNTWMT